MSPAKILEGFDSPDLKTKIIAFGNYDLVHTGTTNDMSSRRTQVIALSESNSTGRNFFMSLHTGKRIHGNSWDELPFDDNVIELVESFALRQNQPNLDNDNVIFGWDADNIVDFNQIEEIEAADAEDDVNDENNPAPYEANMNSNDDPDPDENVVRDDESSIEIDESLSVNDVGEHNQQPEINT